MSDEKMQAASEAVEVLVHTNVAAALWAEMFGDGDPWGTNMGAMFALADCYHAATGDLLPDYDPGMGVSPDGTPLEYGEDFLTTEYWDAYTAGHLTADQMREAFMLMSVYDDTMREAGLSY